jgi:hypothetical protein
MTAQPAIRKGHRYRRYACLTDRGGCNRCGIGAEPLEELIVEAVLQRLESDQMAAIIAKGRRQDASPANEVDDISSRLDDLAAMFAAGEISRSEWSIARRSLADRMTAAQQAEAEHIRSSAVAPELADPRVLRKEWPDLSLDRQRRFLGEVIERVTIAPTTKGDNRFNPDRIDVTWRA